MPGRRPPSWPDHVGRATSDGQRRWAVPAQGRGFIVEALMPARDRAFHAVMTTRRRSAAWFGAESPMDEVVSVSVGRRAERV